MSWLSRLIGRQSEPAPSAAAAAESDIALIEHGSRIVSIPELDMVGHQAKSPNGRFMLVWRDRHGFNGEPVAGRYILLAGGAVLLDREMERPQDGKVAEDGTFILNDWGAADALAGTFHAFRADGNTIVSREYSANLLNNGLSPDGRLAVCQTCNAPGSPDSSILTVFDLEAGIELARWSAESGWANGYEFPDGGQRIRMLRHERPPLEYSLAGEFFDRRLWLQDEVARGTLYALRKALAEGEAATGVSVEALRQGTKRLIAEDERFQAEGWRLLGEIEESVGNPIGALQAYDRALGFNPKIGVAKRAAALRKAAQ